mmetsp:Transcript_27402/g.88491  ORF Transcript_27402/g.88491 Transcript_27402/m.88491 type:complete len:142 (+) Transcript_27402:2187-2612(+)
MAARSLRSSRPRSFLSSSARLPWQATVPSELMITTWSAKGRATPSWWVARTTVFPRLRRVCLTTNSKRCSPTWASTAERGSSRMYMSASWYTALARATRCCWPPERVTPRSPTSVASPAGNVSRSASKAQAWMHRLNRASS